MEKLTPDGKPDYSQWENFPTANDVNAASDCMRFIKKMLGQAKHSGFQFQIRLGQKRMDIYIEGSEQEFERAKVIVVQWSKAPSQKVFLHLKGADGATLTSEKLIRTIE